MKTIRPATLCTIALLAACGSEDPPIEQDPTTGPSTTSTGTGTGGAGGATSSATGAGGSGASGGNGQGEGYESGSRLRARVITGADGSKQFVGWQDTKRAEPCTFQKAADGKTRCLPGPAHQALYFADASCTTRLASLVGTPCDPPKYALVFSSDVCSSGALHGVGSKHTPPNNTIYFHNGATCLEAQATPSFSYYLVGAEIPASEFVEGSEAVE